MVRVALGGGAWGGEQVVVEVARRLPEVLHCARGRRAAERRLLPAALGAEIREGASGRLLRTVRGRYLARLPVR